MHIVCTCDLLNRFYKIHSGHRKTTNAEVTWSLTWKAGKQRSVLQCTIDADCIHAIKSNRKEYQLMTLMIKKNRQKSFQF